MAIGAITVNETEGAAPSAPLFVDDLQFAGDGAYPTGGTADFEGSVQAKLKQGRTVLGVIDIKGVAGHYPVYDRATDKLLMFVRTTGVEVANGVDLSGTTFRILVISA